MIAMQNLLFSWPPAPPSPQPNDAARLRVELSTRIRAVLFIDR